MLIVVDGDFTFEINKGADLCTVMNCNTRAGNEKAVRVTVPGVGNVDSPVCARHYDKIQKSRRNSSSGFGRCPLCNRCVSIKDGKIEECNHGKDKNVA